ncbi:hypothetical protein E2C01_043535 [Portunus trituberculatus]|uniref:Uncharacterized protein n=1 Tax=Portunus trituberculatus TaxID=210409 RepID=A0A5B7FZU5_PORTR|nr:hypothetical protein [Portunus trituberculatus]
MTLKVLTTVVITDLQQNGEASSISTSSSNCNREQHSVQQKKQLQDGASHSPDYLQKAPESHLWTKRDTGERHEAEEMQASPSLLPLTLENGRKRNEIILGSQKTTGLLDLPPPLESKPESDTSINGKYLYLSIFELLFCIFLFLLSPLHYFQMATPWKKQYFLSFTKYENILICVFFTLNNS